MAAADLQYAIYIALHPFIGSLKIPLSLLQIIKIVLIFLYTFISVPMIRIT